MFLCYFGNVILKQFMKLVGKRINELKIVFKTETKKITWPAYLKG